MVYHIASGCTDYDPTLMALPGTDFTAMDGDIEKVELVDPTSDGGMPIMQGDFIAGRPVRVDANIPTKVKRLGPGIQRAKLLDANMWRSGLKYERMDEA